jgi:hypothetical protein
VQVVAFVLTMVSTVDCPSVIVAGEIVTVTVGAVGVVLPLPELSLPLLPQLANPAKAMASTSVDPTLHPSMSHHGRRIRQRKFKDCRCADSILRARV